jgi:hypothetical protein
VLGRMPKLPAGLSPALEREERVLAWAPTVTDELAADDPANDDPGAVVVTNRGLWLPDRPRLGWHEIHKAVWADGSLTVTPAAEVDAGPDYAIAADAPTISVALAEPGMVPRRVRERVTASVAYTSVYPVPGGGSARVVARRVSGRDGLAWSVRLEGNATQNQTDPAVRAAVDQFVADSKSAIAA